MVDIKTPTSTDLMTFVKDNMDSLSFIPYHAIPGRKDYEQIMAELVSPKGKPGLGRLQIDKTTGFYVDPDRADDTSNLLPPDEFARMSESFPELIFTRATLTLPP
jgi:hypothetical protein